MHLLTVIALLCWVPSGEHHTESFVFRFSPGARKDALALARRAERMRLRVLAELGRMEPEGTVVVVTASRSEFDRAQPGRPLPGWVAGVAYPRRGLIILGPAPPGGRRVSRDVLFAHEYSHLALARAVSFRRLPRWFVEGFADLQAMAPFAADPRGWGGRGALPLSELHKDLGHSSSRAAESYQQSYHLVRFLREQGDGLAFRRLIRLLGEGIPFEQALKEVYGIGTQELATRWSRRWNWERVLVPIVTSGLFLWVLAALLLLLGYRRKRRERREQIAAMEGEEGPDWAAGGEGVGEDGSAHMGGNGSGEEPLLVPGSGVWPEEDEGDGESAQGRGGPTLLMGFGTILIGTVMALLLTALLSLVWPHTRVWVLAGPAVVVTFLGLRLMFRDP